MMILAKMGCILLKIYGYTSKAEYLPWLFSEPFHVLKTIVIEREGKDKKIKCNGEKYGSQWYLRFAIIIMAIKSKAKKRNVTSMIHHLLLQNMNGCLDQV
jgi:hypothetical protein